LYIYYYLQENEKQPCSFDSVVRGRFKIQKCLLHKDHRPLKHFSFTADNAGFLQCFWARPYPQKNREIAINQNNETGSFFQKYFSGIMKSSGKKLFLLFVTPAETVTEFAQFIKAASDSVYLFFHHWWERKNISLFTFFILFFCAA